MGQIPRSTERISSIIIILYCFIFCHSVIPFKLFPKCLYYSTVTYHNIYGYLAVVSIDVILMDNRNEAVLICMFVDKFLVRYDDGVERWLMSHQVIMPQPSSSVSPAEVDIAVTNMPADVVAAVDGSVSPPEVDIAVINTPAIVDVAGKASTSAVVVNRNWN